jgi:CRP/FNR family transcriptional regulator, cyclic AMP receptor protein
MAPLAKRIAFDPKVFLSKIGSGRTIENFAANKVVYTQGDSAHAVYYLQKGKAKITITSRQGSRDRNS